MEPCSRCLSEGVGVPLVPVPPETCKTQPRRLAADGLGAMWRWRQMLPPVDEPVSLGEGGTSLTSAALPGTRALRVLVKDERGNPTGSFKDRLASMAVSRARSVGADTVVVSSTGNAGVAVATYAAAADLQCVLLVAGSLPPDARRVLDELGTDVVQVATFADRWAVAEKGVRDLGWFPITNHTLPPVSSNPVGVHAYRTIAYEIAEALAWEVPEWVVLPVSRGDGLFGVWSGFVELRDLGWTGRVPAFLAVERHGSLGIALEQDLEQPPHVEPHSQVATVSISDPQGTAMALHALRRSSGWAATVNDEQAEHARLDLARGGWDVELSSAAALHGVQQLSQRPDVQDDSRVVMVVTARP